MVPRKKFFEKLLMSLVVNLFQRFDVFVVIQLLGHNLPRPSTLRKAGGDCLQPLKTLFSYRTAEISFAPHDSKLVPSKLN